MPAVTATHHITCGPETGAVTRTQPSQDLQPQVQSFVQIVDTGPNQVGPFILFSMHPPEPCDGHLTLVARNPENTDRARRYMSQEFFLPNPATPGWAATQEQIPLQPAPSQTLYSQSFDDQTTAHHLSNHSSKMQSQ